MRWRLKIFKKENYDKMKKIIHYSLFGVKKVYWWWCVCNICVCVMWGVKTNGNKIREIVRVGPSTE